LDRLRAALADRYTIECELGSGGMATVYLAKDLKHERQVAVKVLRPELAASLGADRFLREIKITANLNHPHILPLLDSGEADGFLFYVMPYVEGESLRDRLNGERQLAIEDAIQIACEVADALEFAHTHDVLHRDIKPENVLLSAGHARVVDFGIARAIGAAGGDRLTETGLAVGTPGYMAPEQVAGDSDVDGRCDLYALGCVLYEMLGGQPPFMGTSSASVIRQHLAMEPTPIMELRPTVPPQVARAISRSLAKNPADRFRSARELVQALRSPAPRRLQVPRRSIFIVGIGALATVTVVAVGLVVSRPGSSPSLAPPVHRQLTTSGEVLLSAIAPDGRSVAYVTKRGSAHVLMLQDVAAGVPVEIAALNAAFALEWAPDGERLLFSGRFAGGEWGVYVLPRLGGTPQRVGRDEYARWVGPDMRIGMWTASKHRVVLVDLATGDADSFPVPGTFEWLIGVDWAPGGKRMALTTKSGQVITLWTAAADGSGQRAIVEESGFIIPTPRWSASGDAVYYLWQETGTPELRKVRVGRRGEALEEPTTLLTGLQPREDEEGILSFSITADNQTLAYTRRMAHSNVWFVTVDRSGEAAEPETRQLTTGTTLKEYPSISPDGEWIAYVGIGPAGRDLFKIPFRGGTPQRLTFTGALVAGPVWSPDGSRIAFGAPHQGTPKVWVISHDGGAARPFEQTVLAGEVNADLAWAPGSEIVYQRPGNNDFHLLDPETAVERSLLGSDTVGAVFEPRYSPTGERVAMEWREGLLIIDLRDGSRTRLGPDLHLHPLGWSPHGRFMYIRSEDDPTAIQRIAASGGARSVHARLPFECIHGQTWDGRHFVCAVVQEISDVWTVGVFDPVMSR
jgi:serine/threonine-protein kinase